MIHNVVPFRTGLANTGRANTGRTNSGLADTGRARSGRPLNRAERRSRSRRPESTPVRDPEMERVAANIADHGLHLVHVGESCDCPDCPEPATPAEEQFGYTVGLTEHGHPELLVRGLGARETAELLNKWGGTVLAGDAFAAGHLLCEGPGAARWELTPVARPAQTLVWAARYFGRDRLGHRPALELVPTRRPCLCAAATELGDPPAAS